MNEAANEQSLPTSLALDDSALLVTWSDGHQQRIAFRTLRKQCPCATCREKRKAEKPNPLQVIEPSEARPAQVVGMRPVGSYGYAIKFSDGHSTGIFTLSFLRSLGSDR